jgi:eukaryotic-like serine/threonine-protein kinase
MENNPSFFKGEEHPVEKMTWFDAKLFCEKIGKPLPMEGGWGKAIRTVNLSSFYWKNKNPRCLFLSLRKY